MKVKYIILILFLTLLLMALFYFLLMAIDREMGTGRILLVSSFIIMVVVFIIKYFLLYMRPSSGTD